VGALVLVGVPAAWLRISCIGKSCDEPRAAEASIPFCSLPDETRTLLANGYREGRSPDIFVVTDKTLVVERGQPRVSWPSEPPVDDPLPIIFSGAGITPGAPIPARATLDRIAPTIAEIIGLRRPHPEVRSGTSFEAVQNDEHARLVLLVVWKGGDAEQLQSDDASAPFLHSIITEGAATSTASAGSVPLDHTSVLTTIGTGGVPSQHGMTGRLIRNDSGHLDRAWGDSSPTSVIATLGDDLDEALDQTPRVGLVATEAGDRGLVGGNWYLNGDHDDFAPARTPGAAARAGTELLEGGYGRDEVPDLLAVALEGELTEVDSAVEELSDAAKAASSDSALVVFTGTGSSKEGDMSATDFINEVDGKLAGAAGVIEATVAGGLFLSQDRLAEGDITEDDLVRALREVRGPDGGRIASDVFSDTAITFARYC
jgi:hypothetical protein